MIYSPRVRDNNFIASEQAYKKKKMQNSVSKCKPKTECGVVESLSRSEQIKYYFQQRAKQRYKYLNRRQREETCGGQTKLFRFSINVKVLIQRTVKYQHRRIFLKPKLAVKQYLRNLFEVKSVLKCNSRYASLWIAISSGIQSLIHTSQSKYKIPTRSSNSFTSELFSSPNQASELLFVPQTPILSHKSINCSCVASSSAVIFLPIKSRSNVCASCFQAYVDGYADSQRAPSPRQRKLSRPNILQFCITPINASLLENTLLVEATPESDSFPFKSLINRLNQEIYGESITPRVVKQLIKHKDFLVSHLNLQSFLNQFHLLVWSLLSFFNFYSGNRPSINCREFFRSINLMKPFADVCVFAQKYCGLLPRDDFEDSKVALKPPGSFYETVFSSVRSSAYVARVYFAKEIQGIYHAGPMIGCGAEGLVYLCIPNIVLTNLQLSPLYINWNSLTYSNPQTKAVINLSKYVFAIKMTPVFNCHIFMIFALFKAGHLHENVIRCYDVLFDTKNVYIVMEYIRGPSLLTFLERQNLTENHCKHIFYQVLKAIAFLHSLRIIHRDIKLENILLKNSSLNNSEILLIDFGHAQSLAPSDDYSSFVKSTKVDLWSAGILLYELLINLKSTNGIRRAITSEEIRIKLLSSSGGYMQLILNSVKHELSLEAKDLLASLFAADDNKRCSAEKALQHPWFNQRYVS